MKLKIENLTNFTKITRNDITKIKPSVLNPIIKEVFNQL